MSQLFNMILSGALVLVAGVLLLGLVNVWRGGNPRESQELMRWRVGLQLGAILLILAILAFRH
ncbi:MAG: twin transmembrane helix small protein [Methylocystis sp.]|nr:twin transmembrane helix small protein [Methylocystis sp.]